MEHKINSAIFKPIRNKTVVAIGGKMYSGKSTVADIIRVDMEIFSKIQAKITPAAARLKRLVNDYYGLTDEEALQVKELLRKDYQYLGTEVVRNNYIDDFWIVLALRDPCKCAIFDDIRFVNEYETVEAHATKLISIWVDASKKVRKERCESLGREFLDSKKHNHASEAFTGKEDFWQYRIKNNDNDHKKLSKRLEPIIKKLL